MKKRLCIASFVFSLGLLGAIGGPNGMPSSDSSDSEAMDCIDQDAPQIIMVRGRLDRNWDKSLGGHIVIDCLESNEVCMIIYIPDTGQIVVKLSGVDDPIEVNDYNISDFMGGQSVTLFTDI